MELHIARKIARLSQKEFAKQAGVSNQFVCMLEKGKRDLSGVKYRIVVRMAQALHLEPDELLTLTGTIGPDDDART